MDARHRWIASKLADSFGVADASKLENQLGAFKKDVDDFFEPTGPVSLTFFYQVSSRERACESEGVGRALCEEEGREDE